MMNIINRMLYTLYCLLLLLSHFMVIMLFLSPCICVCVYMWYMLDTGTEEAVVAGDGTVHASVDMDQSEDPLLGEF